MNSFEQESYSIQSFVKKLVQKGFIRLHWFSLISDRIFSWTNESFLMYTRSLKYSFKRSFARKRLTLLWSNLSRTINSILIGSFVNETHISEQIVRERTHSNKNHSWMNESFLIQSFANDLVQTRFIRSWKFNSFVIESFVNEYNIIIWFES